MRLPTLSRDRDGKPRLKPGITFPRLIAFVVGMLALVVVLDHFVEAPSPYQGTECEQKGIDSFDLGVGTCSTGSSTIVVVDKAEAVRLPTLEAKLLGFHEAKSLHGSAGTTSMKGGFLTFEIAVTNRTDAPAQVARGQFVLYAATLHLEAAGAERSHEPRSFLAREREIPPGGTEDGAVTFLSSGKLAKLAREGGNLDVVNFGSAVPVDEAEAIFSESEYGVIRTYH